MGFKSIGFLLLLFMGYMLKANHIVGGEIEFITLSDGLYRINVIQYFDKAQSENPGPEASVEVYIYSNRTHEVVSTHRINFHSEQEVFYTNQACAIAQLRTSRVLWTGDIVLNPEDYADPEGYYLVWERCCRNLNIINIVNPLGTGMKYVSEIPPLWKDGTPFINSSPELFTPLSDYACIDQLYYVEFTGTDRDGDSLAYTLTSPLNSSAVVAVPIPQPKPHLPVSFITSQGYSVDTMIPGTPPLGILSNGLLTVTPASPGLYVFAVLVEEFREGKKIGQVQRDFQMLVIDGCSPPAPPRVAVKIPGNDFFQPETDTLVYAFNDAKCFDFVVTNISEGETIRLQARGVNFEGRLDSIFSFTQQKVGPNMDSLLVTVCAPDCPPLGERPFVVDLIAGDDACPLPQLDTLRLVMQVQPLPNVFPVFTPGGNQTVTLNENNQFDQLIDATDADGDLIGFSLYIPGVDDPTRYGFDLTITDTRPGMAQALFHWDTNCEKFDFSTRQSFTVFVAVDDQDDCDRPNPDKAIFFCEVILPPNTSPVVDLPGTTDTSRTVLANTSLVIDVSATDADGDTIQLWMVGEGFNPAAYGAVMAPASGTGTAQSVFKWDPDCHLMDAGKPNAFTFLFIAGDLDRCREPNFDTLRYTITVQLPPNDPPALIPVAADFTLEVNVPFRLDIAATDHLDDVMVLSFHDAFRLPPTHTLEFPSVTGAGEVRSTLEWTPECSLLEDGGPTTYTLGFRVTDSACPLAGYDTMAVRFTLMETRRQFDDFLPPNVFTPNGDNLNDVFTMSGQEDPSGNLPADNCDDAFEYITIHDRSGRTVFFSQDRGFVWTGHSNSPGVYFYVVKYTRTMYKGHLQLLR